MFLKKLIGKAYRLIVHTVKNSFVFQYDFDAEYKLPQKKNHKPVSVFIGGDVVTDNRVDVSGILVSFFDLINKRIKFPYRHYKNMPVINFGSYRKFENSYNEIAIKFDEIASNPFAALSEYIKQHDFSLINLETPLSENKNLPKKGFFLSDAKLAGWLKDAGIKSVSLANNHSFDAAETGFTETLKLLRSNDIRYFGGGENLAEILNESVVQVGRVRIGVVAVTQKCNSGFTNSSVTQDCPGIVPMDPYYVQEAITNMKKTADIVIFYPHWSITESSRKIERTMRQTARHAIDSGADIVVGHGPHVVQEVEIYKGIPIFYCLGNMVFGHNQNTWGDNIALTVIFENSAVKDVTIVPLAGKRADVAAPYIITDEERISTLGKIVFARQSQTEKIKFLRGI